MRWFRKEQAAQPPIIRQHVIPAKMLMDAATSLTGTQLCNVVYTAVADKPDVPSAALRVLAQRLDRRADELERSGR